MDCKKVTGNLVFDVKIYVKRKSIWLLSGNMTPDTIGSTYEVVVSIESVVIIFTYADLNSV